MVDMCMLYLQAGELERIEQEITLSLHSMGVSLVNDTTQTEVAYLGITRYLSIYLSLLVSVIYKGFLPGHYKVLCSADVAYLGIIYVLCPCFIYPDLSTFGLEVTPQTFQIYSSILIYLFHQFSFSFVSLISSGVIWEEKKKRYKALNGKTTGLLEAAYQKYVMEIELGHRPPEKIALDNKMEVSFQRE